jgi:ribulose-phosphate 3-epimerase
VSNKRIGVVDKQVKIAAGLFWSDYGYLADTVKELEQGGVDWIHMEMRDGRYMQFNVPRGGIDILSGIRPHTNLEIEVQLQMVRPTLDLYKQLADEGVDLITIPIEHTGETLIEHISFVKELGLKVGVWGWQGLPTVFFEQCIPFVDIIEYECRYPFWTPVNPDGRSPHVMDPIIEESVADLYDMLKKRGRETEVDLMEDGGLNKGNLESFVSKGMNVGEFSSPLMKGPNGKFKPGNGNIAKAARELRAFLDKLSASYRSDDGRLL